MAKVIAVCLSEKKGTVKTAVPQIECIEDYGVKGDAHAGKWHRQVSLMSLKDIQECGQDYPSKEYGVYAENILIDDERLRYLPLGSYIHIGSVILEVTQIGKECHSGCIIQQKTGKCLMPQIGLFTRVIQGGVIHEGDEVHLEIPQKLERQSQLFSPLQQSLLHKQKVVIVGLGALGQMVAQELVRCGIRHLTLIDDDTFSYSNFNRQLYANHDTIGKSKVEITKQELLKIEPLCDIQTYSIHLNKDSSFDMMNSDCLLVDCTDDISTKLLLEDLINQKNIPLIHGAIDGWCGQVATIFPNDNILRKIYLNQSQKTHDSLVVTCNLVASFQVKEIIQVILKQEPILQKQLLLINALYNEIEIIEIL